MPSDSDNEDNPNSIFQKVRIRFVKFDSSGHMDKIVICKYQINFFLI